MCEQYYADPRSSYLPPEKDPQLSRRERRPDLFPEKAFRNRGAVTMRLDPSIVHLGPT